MKQSVCAMGGLRLVLTVPTIVRVPMDDLPFNFPEYKEIIIAFIAGLFAVTAAYIKRPGRAPESGQAPKNPAVMLLLVSFVSLLLGVGMLAAERLVVQLNLDPAGELSIENPGAILCLAGCMLISIGAIWTLVNLCRLAFGAARAVPKDEPPAVRS